MHIRGWLETRAVSIRCRLSTRREGVVEHQLADSINTGAREATRPGPDPQAAAEQAPFGTAVDYVGLASLANPEDDDLQPFTSGTMSEPMV